MSDFPAIILHYFDLRGRAQFIRALLTQRGVPFTDNRIKLARDNSNWPIIREDRDITGDFQKLPFMQWGDLRLNEVLVILDFLDRTLGGVDQDSHAWLQHRQMTSSAFLDLLVPCINLIWCDIFQPQTNVPAATAILKNRMPMHLVTLNRTMQEWSWVEGMNKRSVMASDAVLWEALDVIRLTFDEHISFDDHDQLTNFYEHCPGATTFKQLLAIRPQTITGRPGEADALQVIHESLKSGN